MLPPVKKKKNTEEEEVNWSIPSKKEEANRRYVF